MTRYGKGTAINLTRITSPDQINVINDNFRKIQTQLMGVKNYLEPIAQAGKEANDRLNMYLGSDPPVSHPQMVNYAQKQIAMGPTPPDDPGVGDVWFVTDEEGNVIAIRHWDGTQWVDDVNNQAIQDAINEANQAAENAQQIGAQAQQTAEQATQAAQAAQEAADAATQAANNAQADADDAKTQAQSAVDTANQAAEDAQTAINQAQTAFDNAQDALQKATDTENALETKVDTTQYQTDLQNLQSDIAEKADVTWVNGQLVLKEDAIVKSSTAPTSPKDGQVWLDTSVSPAIVKYWDSTNEQWVKATPTEAGEVGAYTITEVDNALNGKVSVTTYQTDMNNVVTRLDNAESSIQQNADSIALKVDKTTYDADINDETNGLKTRMSNAETAITQNANAIELKASQTDLDALNDTVTDINTSVSQLKVDVDDITTRVTTNEGDISSLQQTATSLTTRISDAENNISALQQTSDSFATRITDAENNISTLTQTVDGLQTTVSDVQGDVSTLTQTADSLQSRMTTAEGNISTLTQTTDSLTTQVSAKADQSWVSSQISQLSDDINLRVEKDDIINQINISTEEILIDGAKVHITGETTIDNAVIKDAMIASLTASKLTAGTIDASVITVKNINASNIVTGTLDASKVTVTNIDASKINTGTLNAARIAAGSIDASKLNVSSLSAISANLGNVTAGTLTGVTLQSDDENGNSVAIENGSVISRINNRDMVKIQNYNIYFYDSGKYDPTPDYSEAGIIGSTWSISNPEFRGLSVIGSKDYVSIERSISEDESKTWASFDFKNRLTEIYGGDDATDSGKLHLYSTFKGGTANGRVPGIEIENFTDSNGTPWSGVFVYTGRDNRSPNDSNFRSGFEVWQFRGTLDGAIKQMLKIDTKSSGATYTGIYTNEVWLPWQTFIEAKDGLYYYPCLINISPDIIDIHGGYEGPVSVYAGRTTINIKASENYTYKRMTFSWTENIFFAIAQPYGPYSVYTNARVYNQSSTGFDIYLAWNSDAARTDRTVEVRFLVLLEVA